MMKQTVKWTDAQLLAVRKRGNTLVSAAAGSGKTAVLIEKIMRLLTVSGASLDEMLVVTYTKNAAEELKVKIGKKLSERIAEDPSSARHLGDLPRAVIGTIHSFLLKAVRENYSALGLTPGVSVIGEGDLRLIKEAASDEALDALFSSPSDAVPENEMSVSEVCDVIGGVAGTEEYVRAVYDELRCHGYGAEKISEYADRLEEWAKSDFLASPWGDVLRRDLAARSEHYRRLIDELTPEMAKEESQRRNLEVADRFVGILDLLDRALAERNYEGARRAVSLYDTNGFRVARNPDRFEPSVRFSAIKDEAKKEIFKNEALAADAGEISASMRRTARFIRGFGRAVGLYGSVFEEKKRERGGVDYQDLESFALALFVGEDGGPTPVARRIGERFRYIFVDEYQDANGVQDAIFRAIGENSERFLVGDVKQSIYRFRGGEPEVFSAYREKWESATPTAGDGDVTEPRDAGVFMSTNFRCSKAVVGFANLVSRRMFPFSRVPFCSDDELIFGAGAEISDPVTVCLVDDEASGTTEEQYTASVIRSMIGTDPYGSGPLTPGDFAILTPTNETGVAYADALEAVGIPSSLSLGVDLSKESEIILALDILRAVDNPYRDGPLAGMMYSSVGGFSLDDLVLIRERYGDGPLYSAVLRTSEDDAEDGELRSRCASFVSRLARYRSAERSAPADVFVGYVFSECGIMNAPEVTEKINGADRLRTLLDLAGKYEDGEFGGLFGFLSYIDSMIEAGTFVYTPEKTGAVRIMTVHKSKGLEFPVCFIGKAAKDYGERQYRSSFQFDRELGIGSFLPGEGGYTKYDNPVRKMIIEKKRAEDREEEMRLLYVAMTRAKYKLFVTATGEPSKLTEKATADEWRRDGITVGAIKRPIDHILGAALIADPSVCEIATVTEQGTVSLSQAAEATEEERAAVTDRAAESVKRARENFAFEYPYSFLSNIPSKLAVSKLYPEVLDGGEAILPDDGTPEIPDGDDMPYPTFMTGTTDFSPAEKGTANHVFMQFCDFDRLTANPVADEVGRLVASGFMTPRMAELVDGGFIERFIRGDLFGRMRGARRVWREFRFNVRLPAAKFTADEDLAEKLVAADAHVTVQGVFDCVFRDEDGSLVLVDYKTDAMSSYDRAHPDLFEEKLKERHKTQLSYYKEAAALIFGRAPDEVLIWSLPMGKSVSVT